MTTLVARPTTYNGIRMRSRLEARFAAFLDRTRWDWDYEPRAFASESGQYLPDFVLNLPLPVYLEVRGQEPDMAAALERMRIIHKSEPKALLGFLEQHGLETQIVPTTFPQCVFPLFLPEVGYWTPGAFGVCKCGKAMLFVLYRDGTPSGLLPCACERSTPAGYVNPFGVR